MDIDIKSENVLPLVTYHATALRLGLGVITLGYLPVVPQAGLSKEEAENAITHIHLTLTERACDELATTLQQLRAQLAKQKARVASDTKGAVNIACWDSALADRPTDHWDDDLDPFPVPLPEGGMLVTLRDAGDYIERLPKREHDRAEWQTAMRDLMRAAEGHGPWRFFAWLAIMRALYGKTPPPISNPDNAPPAPKWRNKRKHDPWR